MRGGPQRPPVLDTPCTEQTPERTRLGPGQVQARASRAATSKTDPRQKQDWILKCLQDGRAHPLAARGMALLYCSPVQSFSREPGALTSLSIYGAHGGGDGMGGGDGGGLGALHIQHVSSIHTEPGRTHSEQNTVEPSNELSPARGAHVGR